jgi:hypothetical protein
MDRLSVQAVARNGNIPIIPKSVFIAGEQRSVQ